MTCRLVVVVLLSNIAESDFGVMVPWLGTTEADGSKMGSSFMIALKRYGYTMRFTVMPLNCDNQFSALSQVQTLCLTSSVNNNNVSLITGLLSVPML